jgi:shikimate kinase
VSDNSESTIIQHLKRVFPRPQVLLLPGKKKSSKEQVDLRDMFK